MMSIIGILLFEKGTKLSDIIYHIHLMKHFLFAEAGSRFTLFFIQCLLWLPNKDPRARSVEK